MVGIAQGVNGQGLDLANLDETTQDEIDAYLTTRWRGRGPLYDQYAMSLMLDYAPDFAKLHWPRPSASAPCPPTPNVRPLVRHAQLDPAAAQLHGPGLGDGHPQPVPRPAPSGSPGPRSWRSSCSAVWWPACAGSVTCTTPSATCCRTTPTDMAIPRGRRLGRRPGRLRLRSRPEPRDLTEQDRTNLTAWYERTIGYVPNSVEFGMRYDPQVLKVHRAMWERAIKTLPKQIVPYLMLRDATLNGDRDALREAALLGKAWGLTPDWIVRAITQTVQYFAGLRGMYAAYNAVDDILKNWS